ncbi:MAG: hypothetical protein Q9174_005465 [Haloplaca sp. 1 TL-2023]
MRAMDAARKAMLEQTSQVPELECFRARAGQPRVYSQGVQKFRFPTGIWYEFVSQLPDKGTEFSTDDPLSPVDGHLIAVKDNICTLDHPTTCASAMLQGYRSLFAATVVQHLSEAGLVVAGKTNLDEFGMGSYNLNSVHGPVISSEGDVYKSRTVGGSSGGSALAVATKHCYAALGTDTGGSVRLPAAWTGVVGFKPSYGMLSRWGVVQYANSLDTVGIMARSVSSVRSVYDEINHADHQDPTSIPSSTRSRIEDDISLRPRNRPLRIGIPAEFFIRELQDPIGRTWLHALSALQQKGHSLHQISLPTTKAALAAYYVLAPAEASSNLAKYDGVRYGSSPSHKPKDRQQGNVLFSETRGRNLGAEVRRRILLGSYTLSSTAIDNYFIRAQKVRRLVQDDFNRVFKLSHPLLPDTVQVSKAGEGEEGVDVIVTPTATRQAPLIEELRKEAEDEDVSPARKYCDDVYTVPASLAGLPAISVPVPVPAELVGERDGGGKTAGIQIMGQYGDDGLVLRVAEELEGMFDVKNRG